MAAALLARLAGRRAAIAVGAAATNSAKSGGAASNSVLVAAGATLGLTAVGGATVFVLGQPPHPQDPFKHEINLYEQESEAMGYLLRTRDRLQKVARTEMPTDGLPPMVPPQYRPSNYTLVVDLEDTLIHSEWTPQHGWRVIKRPGVDAFLKFCALNLFEVVVFSDKDALDCWPIIDKLDPDQYITHRLFRLHKKTVNGVEVKDLSVLNRDLSKVIVIDDHKENLQTHPDNWLRIKAFKGDTSDKALITLLPFLQAVVGTNAADLRPILKRYQDVDDAGEAYLRQRAQLEEAKRAREAAAAAATTAPAARPTAAGVAAPAARKGWLW